MNNKCKYLMIRKKQGKIYGYCKLYKKETTIFCKCEDIEYKEKKQLKKTTYSHSKKERSRKESLFTNNMELCYLCKKRREHIHEVFGGSNRLNSIKYRLILPLCNKCHQEMHKNKQLQDIYHKKGQELFNIEYNDLNFIDIFHRNYL